MKILPTTIAKNIATALAALALATTGALIGCRTQHLGSETGAAYDKAFAAQREAEPTDGAGLSADDAKRNMQVHRLGPKAGQAAQTSTPGGGAPTMGNSAPATSGSGAWQGAGGNITLEAK